MKASTVVGLMIAGLMAGGLLWGQAGGVFGGNSAMDISTEVVGGQVGYDPEIGTVQDGVIGDVRATVSADRRYVQLDMHPTVSRVVAIDNFLVIVD